MNNSDFDFGKKYIPKTLEEFHAQIRTGYRKDIVEARRRRNEHGQFEYRREVHTQI